MKKHYPIEVLHWAGMNDTCLPDLQKVLEQCPQYLDFKNQYEENALIIASREDNIHIVRYLVEEMHIDINYANNEDNALFAAIRKNSKETIAYLLSLPQLNVHFINNAGKNAFHIAAYVGNDDAVELLLQRGVDINHFDEQHQHCLYDYFTNFTFHKNTFCFDILEDAMLLESIASVNDAGINILQHIEKQIDMVGKPSKIEKKIAMFEFASDEDDVEEFSNIPLEFRKKILFERFAPMCNILEQKLSHYSASSY